MNGDEKYCWCNWLVKSRKEVMLEGWKALLIYD